MKMNGSLRGEKMLLNENSFSAKRDDTEQLFRAPVDYAH
jgi:hypothetical protein